MPTSSGYDYEAIVIGAGAAGIYQIKRLVDLGIDATVLDAAPDLGGTLVLEPLSRRPLRLPRATLTATRSRASCSTSGTGRSGSRASRRTCGT